jgi:hypothetical protein
MAVQSDSHKGSQDTNTIAQLVYKFLQDLAKAVADLHLLPSQAGSMPGSASIHCAETCSKIQALSWQHVVHLAQSIADVPHKHGLLRSQPLWGLAPASR